MNTIFNALRHYRLARYIAYLIAFVMWLGPLSRDVWFAVVREVRTSWCWYVDLVVDCERSHATKGMSQRPKLRDIDFTDL